MDYRQSANAFYLLVFLVVAYFLLRRTKDGKQSLSGLLRNFFVPAILVPVVTIILWNVGVVFLLYRAGLWNASMLWDTVMFVAIGAIGSLFGAIGKTYDLRFFGRTVLKNAGIIALLEFVTNFYTLGWWEFLLVPALAFLGIMYAFAQTDEKYKAVENLFGCLTSVAGFALLGHALLQVIKNFGSFATVNTAITLALPVTLAVTFIPLLYVLCAWVAYDEAMRMLWWEGDDRAVDIRNWKKRRLLLRFGFNLAALQRFRRSPNYQEYRWATSKDEAKRILRTPVRSYEDDLFEEEVEGVEA